MRNIYNYNSEPVTPAKYRPIYDGDGNPTGEQELVQAASEEVVGLVVTQAPSRDLADIQPLIDSNKKGLDRNLDIYLSTIDPAQVAADKWYEQHLLVESSDPNAVITHTFTDENGDEQVEVLPNDYEKALAVRSAIEAEHDWLRGLRGLSAPERPERMTIEQWKADNAHLFAKQVKQEKAKVLDELTVEVDGIVFQANATSQGRIIGKLTGMQRRGETTCSWKDAQNNIVSVTLAQLEQAADTIEATLEQLILK